MIIRFVDVELLNSIIIIAISILLAWIIQYFFGHTVKRFTKTTRTGIDDLILHTLQKPVYYSVLLFGLYISLNSMTLDEQFIETLKNLLFTLGFFVWTLAISNIAGLLLEDFKSKLKPDRNAKIDSDVVPFIENLVKMFLIGLAIIFTLDLWGIDVTPLLASAGVAGVALAFAAKDTVSNLFGGVSIFVDRPYRVGDYVFIDNQYRGEVMEIGMRSTKLSTRDNVMITVPNAVMVTQSVVNETGYDPKMRLRITLVVDYSSDLEKVEDVLKEVAQGHNQVLDEPRPRVRFRAFVESGIQLELLGYINAPVDKGRVTHELIKDIKLAFDQEKIVIPYPHHEVFITNRK